MQRSSKTRHAKPSRRLNDRRRWWCGKCCTREEALCRRRCVAHSLKFEGDGQTAFLKGSSVENIAEHCSKLCERELVSIQWLCYTTSDVTKTPGAYSPRHSVFLCVFVLCYCQCVLKKHIKGLLYFRRRKPDAVNAVTLPTIPSWITNPSYHIYIMSFVETSTRVSLINTSCLFLLFPVLIPFPPLYMSKNVPIEKRMSYSHKYIHMFKVKLRITVHSEPLWLGPMGVWNIICNSGVVGFFPAPTVIVNQSWKEQLVALNANVFLAEKQIICRHHADCRLSLWAPLRNQFELLDTFAQRSYGNHTCIFLFCGWLPPITVGAIWGNAIFRKHLAIDFSSCLQWEGQVFAHIFILFPPCPSSKNRWKDVDRI